MPLTLKIVSKQKHILGADSVRVFSVRGGSIGRAADNDWVLPDPDRFISGHHASIDYRDGTYYLRDTSTNGVFVNRADEPVGRGTPLRLYDGDELRMGDYLFRVSIIQVSQNESGSDGPRLRRKEEDPASLSLKLLSESAQEGEDAREKLDRQMSGRRSGGDDMLATVRVTDPEVETPAEYDPGKVAMLKQETSALMHVGEGSLRLDPGADAPAAAAAMRGGERRDFSQAVRVLMEAAGLDASQLPREDEEEVIATAGRIIRAAAEGLRVLLEQRRRTQGQFRIAQTGFQQSGNNPLKLMSTTQEALEQLFYRQEGGDPEAYLGPLEAMENAVRDLRLHEVATLKAMQVAVRDLLDKLDPETLEARFGEASRGGGLLAGSAKSRYWELYQEAYRSVAGFRDENFAAVIGARFAEAYDREVQAAVSREGRKKRS